MRAKMSGLPLPVLILLAGLALSARAAVTFTVTPATVSNSYNGTITLQVAGLTNGEPVVVQKFMDLNTNGVIDTGDWLVQQFSLTDGQAAIIGGVTNLNVPGDLNAATGAITAVLNFQNGDFMQNVATKYLYKLSSPGGHFTPITNLFTVTNYPFAQKVSGNVVNSGTNVPNAVVLMFGPPEAGKIGPGGSPLAGVVANNSGAYTIQVPAGTYMPAAFRSNYLVNFAAAPVVTLSGGVPLATNLTVTNATASITGKVQDAGNASLGLPGTLMSASATNGLFGIGFSDTNGNFTLRVGSGQWGTRGSDDYALIVHGYAGIENQTNVSAGASGVVFAVSRGTVLMYGRISDPAGNPLPGVDVYVNDNVNQQWETDGNSDANGNYFVTAPAGTWWGQIDNSHSPSNYVYPGSLMLTMTNGQTLQLNLVALPATNHITGSLKDNSGNPIGGVGIYAGATINGVYYEQDTRTDSSGNYSLNIANTNTWSVSVNNCTDCSDGLSTNYLAPDSLTAGITNNNAVVNLVVLLATNHITGNVQDSNSNPINGLGVSATAIINSVSYTAVAGTGTNGNYSLNVATGDWTVLPDCSANSSGNFSDLDNLLGSGNYTCPGSQDVNLGLGSHTANFIVQLCAGPTITTASLPDGEVNADYNQFLQGTSCNGVFNWSLLDSQDFPGSLGWSGNGQIQGTPNSSGQYNFTVQLDDGNGHSTNQNLTLTILPELQIATIFLPGSTDGAFYSQQIQASNGLPPYVWSLAPGSSNLPPNLSLSTNGLLSGTLSTNGTFVFTLQVLDSLGGASYQQMSLAIAAPAPLAVTTASLPTGTNGAAYSQVLQASGGLPPYRWSLAPYSAGLPPNLSIATNGTLAGTPATNGTYYFYARVTDAASATADQYLALSIVNPPLQFTTTSLPNAAVGVGYTNQLAASGGYPPYYWYLATGSAALPANLVLANNGVISGVPATNGTFYFLVQVYDSFTSLTKPLSITINYRPVLGLPTRLSASQLQFPVTGVAGQTCTILVSSNLNAWSSLYVTNPVLNSILVTDPAATNKQRFYRLKLGL